MSQWTDICKQSDLTPNTGICAKFNQQQVAIFFCQRQQSLYAVSNYDPIGGANVISRGMIGSINSEFYVSSPLFKQHFHLETGVCLEAPEHRLKTYLVRVNNDHVQLKETAHS